MTNAVALNPVSRIQGNAVDMGAYEKRWLKDSVLVMDASSSMLGDKEDYVPFPICKYLAGLHVDTMKTNDMVGCVAFRTTAWTVHQLDEIGTEAAKGAIKQDIDALVATGLTSLAAGIAAGVEQLRDYGRPDGEQELVLFTDTAPDSYAEIDPVPPGIRVHTLMLAYRWWESPYGRHAWTAQRRDGLFLAYPTPVGILGLHEGNVLMGEESPAPVSGTNSHDVLVDDSVNSVVFRSYWDYGGTGLTMQLESPGGQTIVTNNALSNIVCHAYGGCVMYEVLDPEPGCWKMKITGGAAAETYAACAYCDSYVGADMHLDRLICTTGEQVRVVVRTSPLATNVTVTTADGWESSGPTFDLYDDGLHGDGAANDGLYASTNSFSGAPAWRLNATVTGMTEASNAFRRVAECSLFVNNLNEFDGAPTDLLASDGTKSDAVDLTWSAVVGAAYYDVYRSTSDSIIDARLIHVATETQYSDTNVLANVTYRYWIRAHATWHIDSEFSAPDTGYPAP